MSTERVWTGKTQKKIDEMKTRRRSSNKMKWEWNSVQKEETFVFIAWRSKKEPAHCKFSQPDSSDNCMNTGQPTH